MSNTLGEAPALLAAVYAGLCIGALLLVASGLRGAAQPNWLKVCVDILFWAAAGVAAAVALIAINGGRPRLYLLLGILAGAWCFTRFVSRPVRQGFMKLSALAAARRRKA